MKKVCHIQRRHEICMAAVEIIARDGIAGLSTRTLAKYMGCSIGVLSHYYSSKNEILEAANRWPVEQLEAIYRESEEQGFSTKGLEHLLIASLPLTDEMEMIWKVEQHFAALALVDPSYRLSHSNMLALVLERTEKYLLKIQESGTISDAVDIQRAACSLIDWYSGFGCKLLYMTLTERHLQLADLRKIIAQILPFST